VTNRRSNVSQEANSPCRRKSERSSATILVLVHRRGRFQRAKIADYSQAGLQLQGTFGLIPTDRVEIELKSGVRVPGKVEGSLGGQTGVVFAEPLNASHPALTELAHSTRQRSQAAVSLASTASDTSKLE
jgi:hypothetical protein